ncbi:MAG: FxLYD domain-containing protein [Bacilli bacterium]|nr:FxLYD domain-containing protein [Bacilli bacterium]MBR3209416.1 FxLYD domain-containing protein [Bacilli bacterium]
MKTKIIEGLSKKHNTKVFLVGLLFTIILLGIAIKSGEVIVKKENENNVTKDAIFNGVRFSNIKMVEKDGSTIFTADLTNTTKKEIKIEEYYIDLYNKDDKLVITLLAFVPYGLKPNETKDITASATGSLKEAVTKIIRLKKDE